MTTFTLPKKLWTKWLTNSGYRPALNKDVQQWCSENLSEGSFVEIDATYFDHSLYDVDFTLTLTIPDDVEAVAFKMVWL